MKVPMEDRLYIKNQVDKVLEQDSYLVSDYEHGRFRRSDKVKDLQVRFMWDLYALAGINLGSGYNDSNIETALRKVCPTITRKY